MSHAERASELLANGRIEEACALLERALKKKPKDWAVLEALGNARLQDGKLEASARALEKSMRLHPNAPRAALLLGDVHAAAGRQDAAEAAFREAIRLRPAYGQAWLRLMHLRKVASEDGDVARVRELLDAGELAPAEDEALSFALGKAYDDLGRAEEAFAYIRRANELHKQRQPFDMGAMEELVERIITVCNRPYFARTRELGSESEIPVFIVGMPRCGSTLVEQIISSHPRAYGVGELRTLARLTGDLPARLGTRTPFPDCLSELDRAGAESLAGDYLRRLTRDAPADVLRVCDKMLSHLLLVGLIAAVFPNARVLHVRRHLLDLGLSMYMHSFSGSGVGYAYDLEHIGRYHRLAERLARHWKRLCPLEIVDVEYEALVSEPELGVRRLLDAVGLPFDPRCLESHRAERQVRTVSDWQVRQPIHARAVARWRRYERELAPLAKYLDQEP